MKNAISLRDNFERYVVRNPEGCWGWTGPVARNKGGYAVMTVNRKHKGAHRISLELDGRKVPTGMLACHHCDNPICTNPAHLYVGTHKQNSQDAVRRGRMAKGEVSGVAVLTEQIVREIRGSEAPNVVWAKALGVSRGTIRLARLHATWAHVQ